MPPHPTRRRLIALMAAVAFSAPRLSVAQPNATVRKLGILMSIAEADPETQPRLAAFRQGLRDLGWKEGENIRIDYRWSDGRADVAQEMARELVALAPDVILANGTFVVAALKPLTTTIPIVSALVMDPVHLGLARSLSRPGGNITGFSFINPQILGKWTDLLKEASPGLRRAALLYNPKLNPWYGSFLEELADTPKSTALELTTVPIQTLDDLQREIPAAARVPGTALIIGPESFILGHMDVAARIAAREGLPGVSVYRKFVVEGGLMTYGPDVPDIFRRAAGYVDRVLKGANPADLPVQQPTKFDFVVNLKAAKALGLTLSPTLMAWADDVID